MSFAERLPAQSISASRAAVARSDASAAWRAFRAASLHRPAALASTARRNRAASPERPLRHLLHLLRRGGGSAEPVPIGQVTRRSPPPEVAAATGSVDHRFLAVLFPHSYGGDPRLSKPRGNCGRRSMGKAIGIDLGTTNSCCAYVMDGKPQVVTYRDGSRTIPSGVRDRQARQPVGRRTEARSARPSAEPQPHHRSIQAADRSFFRLERNPEA